MNNFTPRAQQVLLLAGKAANQFGHNYIGTEHLFLGLISLDQGVAVVVLQKMNLNLDSIRSAIESEFSKNSSGNSSNNIPYTTRVKKVLALADKEAKTFNHSYIGTEHILLGLLSEEEGIVSRILQSLNIDIERCRQAISIELNSNYTTDQKDSDSQNINIENIEENSKKNIKTPALKAFGRDLTDLAFSNKLDPVIGRKNEINRIIQILCRRTKNNPVLIGEAGVGKTAIIEGLAKEIISGAVPDVLSQQRIIALDLSLMLAGTKYRGQFEERVKAIMEEIRRVKNIIIFIDELHTIVGTGAAEGSMDISNIFKPALSRGELQCIGATTISEYRKYIEKDTALDRRFQSIKVEAPSVSNTIKILMGIRHKYESHHCCTFTNEAIQASAVLAERYITNRFLPDTAIDILDEAGSRAHINSLQCPKEVNILNKKVKEISSKKEKAISKQNFEEAAKLRDEEKTIKIQSEQITQNWKNSFNNSKIIVNKNDLLVIIADWLGIPLSRIEEKESKKLLELEHDLQSEIIGQKSATEVIAKALRRSRANLKDPNRPIGSFMFLGPTGVGKTYLAKILAKRIFGNSNTIIQIDMSEYMEKFSVSKIIGSPPGYVGYDEGGQLTEKVRRKPYSIVLFDEIEKAHPDVIQILLQVLEEGKLTDSFGRVIDFKNTILIMTSNIGAGVLQKSFSIGFSNYVKENSNFNNIKEKIIDEAKRFFKPEFLNRIDNLVVFHTLTKKNVETIINLELKKVEKRLNDNHGIKFYTTKVFRSFLAKLGYDFKYGARPLRRTIEKYLEDCLAEAILKNEIKYGELIEFDIENEKPVYKKIDNLTR